jgi:hypothetical protein
MMNFSEKRLRKKKLHKEDFSKVSTGKFPVSNGPVEFLNRSGPVPALQRVGSRLLNMKKKRTVECLF